MWSALLSLLQEFGPWQGLFLLVFFIAHVWYYRANEKRFAEREREINRLSEENNRLMADNQKHTGRIHRIFDTMEAKDKQ